MSATDYRTLIDLHGGHYIGIECQNGTTIEIGINGHPPAHLTPEHINNSIIPRLQGRMRSSVHDGVQKFTFGFGQQRIELNYYDAGLLLDRLREAVGHTR